jgi:assimilatory nitrate reductase catalytic subunit
LRTDLAVNAELAGQLGSGAWFTSEPGAAVREPRCASTGGAVDYAGVTWERVDAEDGVFRPRPSVDRSGMLRLLLNTRESRSSGPT